MCGKEKKNVVTINKAIKRAIEIKGKSLLSDSQLLILVLEDLAPELIHEREIIIRYHTSEIGKQLIYMYDDSTGQKERMLSELETKLTQHQPNLYNAYHEYLSFFKETIGCTYSSPKQEPSPFLKNDSKISTNSIQPPEMPYIEAPSRPSDRTPTFTVAKDTAQRSPPLVKTGSSSARLSRKDSADLDALLDQHNNRLLNYHKKAKMKKTIISIVIIGLIVAFLMSFIVGLLSRQGKSTVLRGDLNGDGVVTNADLELLQDYLVDTDSIPEDKRQAADYDGDGKITSHDALQMKKDLKGE